MKSTGYRFVTQPQQEAVSVEEIKAYLGLADAGQDILLASIVKAAREMAERQSGRVFVNRSLEAVFECFDREFLLPGSPLVNVTSITYINEDGTEVTVDPAEYTVDTVSLVGRIVFRDWQYYCPAQIAAPVCVRYVAGFGDTAASVPENIKLAIKQVAADAFEHRESQSEVSLQQNRLARFLFNSFAVVEVG